MSPSHSQPAAGDATRQDRETLLTAARSLIGHTRPYAGAVVVRIVAPDMGSELKVVPTPGCDGMHAEEREQPTYAAPAELISVLFSRDEVRILSEMLDGKAVKAKSVQTATKISESKFWCLWSNLQQRGIVVDADEGEGFVIGLPWVAEYIAARAK